MENKTLEERISVLEKEVQRLKYKPFNFNVEAFARGFNNAIHVVFKSLSEEKR